MGKVGGLERLDQKIRGSDQWEKLLAIGYWLLAKKVGKWKLGAVYNQLFFSCIFLRPDGLEKTRQVLVGDEMEG